MAKYVKGKSGNPNGRPKGSLDEKKAYIRDWVISIIGANGKRLEQEFQNLPLKEKFRTITQLLPYVLPRQHEAIVEANMEVHPTEPLTIRFVASKEDLERIQNEIPDLEDRTGEHKKGKV